jgi:hypothetical protein
MRRLALCAVLVPLVLPAVATAAGIGTDEVSGSDSVYVRPRPQSWTIGTLYRVGPNVPGVEHMDVQEISPGGWAYGYVYGSFQGCGWVDAGYLRKVNSTVSKPCPTDDATRQPGPESMFSEWTDPAKPDGKDWHTIECAPAGASRAAYGNYRRGGFVNKYGDLPANWPVDWRYTTKDGVAAMVKDTSNPVGAPAWFFVPRACVTAGPPSPPATSPQPPAPPASPPASPPPPAAPGQGTARRRVCWKNSRSGYCKRLRRACRRKHKHTPRCRRALHGTRKGRG